jgi:hypothetical protein
MSDKNIQIVATWHPWMKKVVFHCPTCDRRLSSKDPLLPKDSQCPKCKQSYTISHATYPISKLMGFLLLAFCFSTLPNTPYPDIVSVLATFVVLVTFSLLISYFLFTNSKRRFKVPTLYYVAGSLGASGWITAYLIAMLLKFTSEVGAQ